MLSSQRRSIFRLIAIGMILFLLWQLFLIGWTLIQLCLSIPSSSFVVTQLNESKTIIPKIIHQLWRTSNLSTYPMRTSHSRWQQTFPNYKVRLWTDVDLDQLISSSRYSYLLNIYKSYPYAIQRADLARLMVIHFEGGIYADLDVFPRLNKSIERLRSSGASFIIPRSSTNSSLINHFLVAEPNSSLVEYILRRIPSPSLYRRIFIPYLDVFSTGSILLTRLVRQWINDSTSQQNKLWILSFREIRHCIDHGTGRSWHLFDGYIFNKIEDSRFFRYCLISSVVLLVFIIKYQKLLRLVHLLRCNK